jgi:hypothetical protein
MLTHSFIHFSNCTAATEEQLWSEGVTDWDEFERQHARDQDALKEIDESRDRLDSNDARYFDRRMPSAESWRLYRDFCERAVFLDIETTGLGGEAYTTMCGTLDREGFHAFVRGENLDELPGYLDGFDLVVSFNGRAFDVPFLRREFGPGLLARAAHMDLLHVLRRLGLRGGLKRIEQALGVGRPSALSTLDGRDAVVLWNMAQEGEPEALETLVRYNAEDVLVLPRLAALAVTDAARGTPMEEPGGNAFPEPDISGLPFDASLIYHLASLRGKGPVHAW